MRDYPLVSAIMPTKNRTGFLAHAVHSFFRQDYPNKELIIIPDSTEPHASVGAKRNEAISRARGDLILHWDDDDWMAPTRISEQVRCLLRSNAAVCGAPFLTYLDLAARTACRYAGPQNGHPWLAGGTLLYRKSLWEHMPFNDHSIGEDAAFLDAHNQAPRCPLDMSRLYIAIRHGGNTNPVRISRRWVDPPGLWMAVDISPVLALLGDDRPFYESMASRIAPSSSSKMRDITASGSG